MYYKKIIENKTIENINNCFKLSILHSDFESYIEHSNMGYIGIN